MAHSLKKEKKYSYIEAGEGTPIIVLHGLMGGLSNFDSVTDFFSAKGYKVLIPELPISPVVVYFIFFKYFFIVSRLGNCLEIKPLGT